LCQCFFKVQTCQNLILLDTFWQIMFLNAWQANNSDVPEMPQKWFINILQRFSKDQQDPDLSQCLEVERVTLVITVTDSCKGSISSTFYEQLLCAQIPKAQKRLTTWLSFFALLSSLRAKSAGRMTMKLRPDSFAFFFPSNKTIFRISSVNLVKTMSARS